MTKPARSTIVASAIFIMGLIGVAAITGAINRPMAEVQDAPILQVSTVRATELNSYPVTRAFVGRVEARRESEVGFELGGLLEEVTVDDGETVRKGQVLAKLDTVLLEATRAELISAKAQKQAELDLARITQSRVQDANALDAVSSQMLDEAREGFNAAKAALENTRSAILSIDARIAKSVMTAPYDALISSRFADEGQVINAGAPVLRLLENTMPEIRMGISGTAIEQLQIGDEYDIQVREQTLKGRLRTVLPERQRGTRGIDAIFTLSVPFNGIRRGDLARLELTEVVPTNNITLPLTALTESARGIWAVYVLKQHDGQQVLDRRQVEVLHHEGEQVYVRGTLRDGQAVVDDGLHRLVPGQLVSTKNHRANNQIARRGK